MLYCVEKIPISRAHAPPPVERLWDAKVNRMQRWRSTICHGKYALRSTGSVLLRSWFSVAMSSILLLKSSAFYHSGNWRHRKQHWGFLSSDPALNRNSSTQLKDLHWTLSFGIQNESRQHIIHFFPDDFCVRWCNSGIVLLMMVKLNR